MRARLVYLIWFANSSFWFVPTVMGLAAAALAFATLRLDGTAARQVLLDGGWMSPVDAQAARLILSTLAGSTMAAMSLVFSLVLLVLTVASQQLGPRLLATFMADRVTQLMLGAFVATFLYSLLVLRAVRGAADEPAGPLISLATAMLLAVLSIALLIYFIHHLARSLQADMVVAHVGAALDRTIAEMFDAPGEAGERRQAALAAQLPAEFAAGAHPVRAQETGYIEVIDTASLLDLAAGHGLILRLRKRAGHFVMPGTCLAELWPATRSAAHEDAVRAAIVVGPARTPAQDIEYHVKAVVEVALRALSPALNDTHTGLACIDRLGASLALAMRRAPATVYLGDRSGHLRLVLNPVTVEGLIDAALREIEQTARGNVAIAIRLLDTLAELCGHARADHLPAIARHAAILRRSAAAHIEEPFDRAAAEERLAVLDRALAVAQAAPREPPRGDRG